VDRKDALEYDRGRGDSFMKKNELYNDLDRVLIKREEIAEKVRELGERITQDYQGKKPVLVCILKGASVFFADLIREIDLPLTLDFMAISSYGSATKTSGVVRILKDLDNDILGKDVIIVEDIVDTGVTLSYLTRILMQRGAKSLRIAALLDKPARRKVPDLKVDYMCFDIPDAFVVGYGLDYNQTYRNLPDIGILHPRIYES
jgi:hypoxanthine phosphoribosyltransferase